MSYLTEPDHTHGQAARTGILLINLGTPEAPTAQALRPYLKEFLSDPRVVEIPRAVWWLILNGVILNTRPKKSAEKYAAIWTADGSPLKVHTEKQAKLLKGWLGEKIASPFMVEYAMRYGKPSVADTLTRMKAAGCDRILLLPAYPQYAASSTRHRLRCRLCLAAENPQPAGIAHGQALPRPPRLHPGAGRQHPRLLADARPPRCPADELSRRAALHAGQGRPLPLRMPENRTAAGRGAGA